MPERPRKPQSTLRLTREREAEIRAALDFAADFSDGAFWGYLLTERGFEAEEVAAVMDEAEEAPHA